MLWQGGVVVDVVDHRDISNGLRVYQREEGEETINREQKDTGQAISSTRGVLT